MVEFNKGWSNGGGVEGSNLQVQRELYNQPQLEN